MYPPPLITHKARRVTIIVMDHGTIFISQITNGGQVSNRAIHRKNAVCGDQDASGAHVPSLLEFGLEIRHVVVAIAVTRRFAQAHAVNNGGVVELIGNHRILRAQNRLKQTGVGVETGGIQNGVFHGQKMADPSLKGFMNALSAADKTHRCGAKTPFVQTVAGRLLHFGIVGEPQVVVGAHIDDVGAPLEGDVVFLVRDNDALGFPETCCFDLGNLFGIARFSGLVTHINPSNPKSLCLIDPNA